MILHPLPSHGVLRPYGLLVHTTGDGIPAKIISSGDNSVDVTKAVYGNMSEGPHYAIVPDGTLIKFRSPATLSYHAKTEASQRRSFLDGSWEKDLNRIPPDLVSWWKRRWQGGTPSYKSPQHMYPGSTPNKAYVGVELIPCGHYQKVTWTASLGTPATPKGRYTAAQYTRLGLLALSLQHAFNFPDGWESTGRLCGHEDVNPYTRPGWDPGAYRCWFSWQLFKGILTTLQSGLTINSVKELAL